MASDLYYFYYTYGGDTSYYYGYGYSTHGTTYSGETVDYNSNNNQSGANGKYYITAVYANTGKDLDTGKVFVNDYYDSKTATSYVPYDYSQGAPAGSSGLGSEYDYINTSGGSKYFGKDNFEANPSSDLYSFYYTYGGDNSYYYGYGYATHGTYYSGETVDPNPYNNQSQADGKYYIYAVNSNYGNYSDAGKVFVNDYYDSKTGKSYTPYDYSQGSPSGSSNLGSEYDYINSSSGKQYFGQDNLEADASSDLYYFYYTYGGDNSYYYGYGFATHGTYYSGETYDYTSSNNQSQADGKYYIYAVNSNYGNYSDAGKVFVNDYYDSKTATSYTPHNYSLGSPSGSSGLGSEYDYINSSTGQQYFGRDYNEADASSDLYSFYYTYGGDNSYYYGYGYAYRGTYYAGETYNYTGYNNQSGADGKYYIYAVNSNYGNYLDAGKVFVYDYYSSKTGTSYTPYDYSLGTPSGSSNLGSESDYINTSSGSTRFGNDYYEA